LISRLENLEQNSKNVREGEQTPEVNPSVKPALRGMRMDMDAIIGPGGRI